MPIAVKVESSSWPQRVVVEKLYAHAENRNFSDFFWFQVYTQKEK